MFLDKDSDGMLSMHDLISSILMFNENKKIARKEAQKIMSKFDLNQNNKLEFTEFLIPNIAIPLILNEERLLSAFNMLDIDGDGRISENDLYEIFKDNPDYSSGIEEEIMQEVDCKDPISFQEYKILILEY